MNSVMLLPFIIPVAITSFLVTLLIKERNHFVSTKKSKVYSENKRADEKQQTPKEPYYEKLIRKNKKNLDDYVDYSGGIMGI